MSVESKGEQELEQDKKRGMQLPLLTGQKGPPQDPLALPQSAYNVEYEPNGDR